MKIALYVIISLILVLLSIDYLQNFFRQRDVLYNAFYEIDEDDFYPDAYVVFHSEMQLKQSAAYRFHADEIEKAMSGKFDFFKYSYVIVYGAKIERMYYSFKSTIFDDKSPSYASARRFHKQCLFIEYKEPDGHIYMYQIDRNPELMGFGGD